MNEGVPGAEKPVRVVLCTPTYTKPHPAYVAAVEAAVPALEAAGLDHQIVFEVGSPYISAARATLLRKALDAKADVVVFIDHDLSWRPLDLVKLIQTPGDVVAGLYRFKNDVEEFMGAILSGNGGKPLVVGQTLRAERAPAGFLKVTKEAVDRFMAAYPDLCFGPRYCPSVDLFNHGAHKGVWWGEDYAFSRRWIECGGEIVVVPDLALTHHSADAAYPGNFHEFMMRQPGGINDPARLASSLKT